MMKRTIFSLLLALAANTCVMASIEQGKAYSIALGSNPKKSLMVSNSMTGTSIDLVLWTETDVASQQWWAIENEDGTYLLRNVYTNNRIGRTNMNDGSQLKVLSVSSTIRTSWNIKAVEGKSDTYLIFMTNDTDTLYLSTTSVTDGTVASFSVTPREWKFIEREPKTPFSRQIQDAMMQGWLNQFLREHSETTATLGTGGGWDDAEMMETLLDAYETTGNTQYLDTFLKVYGYFSKFVGSSWNRLVWDDNYHWTGHEFNDDVMWMILALSRAGMLTGNNLYTRAAKRNFDTIYNRAIQEWGTMRWKESDETMNGSNSCINCPTIIAACYIAMATGDESYYEKARSIYEKQSQILFNSTTGQVYDSGSWNPSTGQFTIGNYWVSTYNQGTMLGAAVLLYNHYGTEKYKTHADKIMNRTISELCNANGIVSACQEVSGPRCGLKGILMRYVRRYVTDLAKTERQEWLTKNALHAYTNSNSHHYAHSAWLTKSAENGKFGTNTYTDQPFGCSTAVSAAFNCIMHATVRQAFETIEAEDFDYHQGMNVNWTEYATGNLRLTNLTRNRHAAYYNIDFGQTGARSMTINLADQTSGLASTIEVHTDNINGPLIGTFEIPADNIPAEMAIDITPTTVQHHVFIVFRAEENGTLPYSLDSFIFSESSLAPDYDLNGDGKVSTADIQVIINEMKKPADEQNMKYDLNGDGKISTADIQVIINEMKK